VIILAVAVPPTIVVVHEVIGIAGHNQLIQVIIVQVAVAFVS
jgi:hypothetical protein